MSRARVAVQVGLLAATALFTAGRAWTDYARSINLR